METSHAIEWPSCFGLEVSAGVHLKASEVWAEDNWVLLEQLGIVSRQESLCTHSVHIESGLD